MFFRVMFVKDKPYLYRQHNIRIGKHVRPQICQYIGRLEGGVPLGVQSRPRKPREFGETRTPRVNVLDKEDRESIKKQISLGIAIAASKLEAEKRRKTVYHDKKIRRIRRLKREILALQILAKRMGMWHRL